MIATKANIAISKVAPFLVVASLSSLGTSWFYKTPELHKKEQTLQAVESKTLPALTHSLAQSQTQVRQLKCDKDQAVKVAVQGILADQKPNVAAPDWNDLKGCPKVVPVKAAPVSAIMAKVQPPPA